MSTGDRAGLLNEPKPQSRYKHVMLDQYVIRFATKTASKLDQKRAVLFDGFAGTARFADGSPASAEYMMLAAQKAKATTQVDCFFVERKASSFRALDAVADEYRARGTRVATRHGECGDYLAEAVDAAQGASLFLFIDPCGATLPWTTLTSAMAQRGTWPRTELLLNFSADLPRRAGGQVAKGLLAQPGVLSLDQVCGGTWWRQLALDAHARDANREWGLAAQLVADEYARRLAGMLKMRYVVAPVKRKEHHQPVYFLIFLTFGVHGLWVMADAAARAREAWLNALGPAEDEVEGMLFGGVEDQIKLDNERAVRTIKENLVRLVSDGRAHSVSHDPAEVFHGVYGEAKETAYTRAVRELVREGRIWVTKGGKPHLDVLRGTAQMPPGIGI